MIEPDAPGPTARRGNGPTEEDRSKTRIAIIGISGKLGQYMAAHALDFGYEVVGVCRSESTAKLERFGDRITIVAGDTSDPQVIAEAIRLCSCGK